MFSSFTPILDFIPALSYLLAAATAGWAFGEGWAGYVRWIEAMRQGRVDDALAERAVRLRESDEPTSDAATSSPS